MGANHSKPDPSKHLEVIGAGFSRTGTASTALALERLLNGPVFHGATQLIFGEDRHMEKWVRCGEAKLAGDKEHMMELLREVTTGWVAVTDGPATMFVAEMLELYPDAKVVLMTRDPEKWWHSTRTNMDLVEKPWVRHLTWMLPRWRWFWPTYELWAKDTSRLIGHKEEPPYNWGPGFLEIWNQHVKDIVPEGQLLVSDVKQGWGPLCRFLEKPIPDEPFPKANDSQSMREVYSTLFEKTVAYWGVALAVLCAVSAGLYVRGKLW